MADEFETVELEYSEDDILYYIEDENGTEIGFALEEDGQEVEYYYEGFDAADYEALPEETASEDAKPAQSKAKADAGENTEDGAGAKADLKKEEHAKEPGYLGKLAAIAGHEGNKARKTAGKHLDEVRGKAEKHIDKARDAAEKQVDKATEAVESGGKKLKDKSDEYDLGITREGVAEVTSDLNAIAKEGAETAKELKETYDELMESFGFLVPKKVRRRLP